MKKRKIFISAPYLRLEWDKYKSQFSDEYEIILPDVDERLEESDLLDLFDEHPDIQAGIVGDDKFSRIVYNRAKKLKFLVKWGTGIDSLVTSNNVDIYNTPSAFSVPVSESAIGMMLYFLRSIGENNESMHNGDWKKIKGKTLAECNVGIIGLGNVGREVARKLEVFGCGINFLDPKIHKNQYPRYKKCVSVHHIIEKSDIITIHCDLNETSHHLIGESELRQMAGRILINTARGPIICQSDLEENIETNEHYEKDRIKFGLDVFEDEPLNSEIIRNYKYALLNAHNTNTSPKYWEDVHNNSIKLLCNHFEYDGVDEEPIVKSKR